MKKLAIIGAAELGILIQHLAEQSGKYSVVGFYDDNKTGVFNSLPILGTVEMAESDYKKNVFDETFIAIGYNHMPLRKKLFDCFHNSIPFATIIHPSAYVDPSCKIGVGTVIFPGCIVDQFSNIGNNVLLNTGVSVAHHTTIGDHCFLAPRVNIAGRTEIKNQCFIGIGSIILDLVVVECNCTIGAGSLVLKSIEPDSIVFGSPAKKIKSKK